MHEINNILYDFVGVFLIFLAFFYFLTIVFDFYSSYWPSVDGDVIKITDVTHRYPSTNKTVKRFFINYEYSVDGKKYKGDRVFVGSRVGDIKWKDALLKGAEGALRVKVYYCPFANGYCLIRPNTTPKLFSLIGVIFGVIVGLFCIFYGL